jgi:hypothetical protein
VKLASPVLLVLVLAAGCGKVGDPKPPIVRTPQVVSDLKVSQNGYSVTLTWTNPTHYVDGNPATDLSVVRILRNGVVVATEPSRGPGQIQTAQVEIRDNLNADLSFAVQVGTQRGRTSPASSAVAIRPVEVPGQPRQLTAALDQLRIILDWQPPQQNADVLAGYTVSRADRPAPDFVQATHFEDELYEGDKTYTYTVTAVRGATERIPGLAGASISVTAKDTKPPATPRGLNFQVLDMGVLLQWNANAERDLKEHLVLRSDQAEPVYRGRPAFWNDPTYRSGLTYRLAAVDTSGNQSPWSEPVAGP